MTIASITSQLQSISWREPLWLLLATVPFFFSWLQSLSHSQQTRYTDTKLLPWATAQHNVTIRQRLLSKNTAFLIAWLLLAIAAAGPRLPLEFATAEQPSNLDIMLVVDVSRSMQATDISPSRLRRAQIEIDELLTRAPGHRIGIITFAARAHLLTPLTSDMSALRFYLRTLDALTLPTAGSDPLSALELAKTELRNSSNPTAILMLTDGDIPTSLTSSTHTIDTPLYILGIGSNEGAAIPLEDGQWLEHEGRPVISRLYEKNLRMLASLSRDFTVDEHYSLVSDDDSDWQKLYDNGLARLGSKHIGADNKHKIIWQQLYHWTLFPAVLLLWVALTPYGLRAHPLHAVKSNQTTGDALPFSNISQTDSVIHAGIKTLLIGISLITFALYPTQTIFAGQKKETTNTASISLAYKNYSNGNHPAAIAVYKQLSGFTARFGEGVSQYKLGKYKQATRQFSRAALAADNDQQRANALFNLGNSYFQSGNYAAAVTTYTDTLKYRPEHKDTLHNLNFSIAIKQAVDKRVAANTRAARMGSGPQLSLSEETSINPSGSLAIDESETQGAAQLPELAELSNSTLAQLINNGLAHIQLAAKTDAEKNNPDYQRKQLSFINARLRMSELEDEHTLLWKRLFEIEEGFPAPLAEPRNIPGVPAW